MEWIILHKEILIALVAIAGVVYSMIKTFKKSFKNTDTVVQKWTKILSAKPKMKQICKELRFEYLDEICRLGVIEVKNGGGIPTKRGKITTSVVVEDNKEGWRDYGGEWQDVYAEASFQEILLELLINEELKFSNVADEMKEGKTKNAFLGEGFKSVQMYKIIREPEWWAYLVICSDKDLPNFKTYNPHYSDKVRATVDKLRKEIL